MAQGRSRNWPVVKICCTVEVLQFLLEHFRSLKIINDSKEFLFMWVMQAGVHVQSCLTLCDCMVCSPPGSSGHWMSQARILEWVALSFSRGPTWPGGWTQLSCIVGRFYTIWATQGHQLQCICIMEYYLAIQRNWVLKYTTIWWILKTH